MTKVGKSAARLKENDVQYNDICPLAKNLAKSGFVVGLVKTIHADHGVLLTHVCINYDKYRFDFNG